MRTRAVAISEARRLLPSLIAGARTTSVGITRRGRVEAVLISPELYQRMKDYGILRVDGLHQLQQQFDKMVDEMRSEQSANAYEAVAAIEATDLPRAVAAARAQLRAT